MIRGQELQIAFLDLAERKVAFSSGLKVAQDEDLSVNTFYNREEALEWLNKRFGARAMNLGENGTN